VLHGPIKSTGSGSIVPILVLIGAKEGLTSQRGRKCAEAEWKIYEVTHSEASKITVIQSNLTCVPQVILSPKVNDLLMA
jgi:hypothetical protein